MIGTYLTTNNKSEIVDFIKFFSTSKSVLKELGEPIVYQEDCNIKAFLIENICVAFCMYGKNKLYYVYVNEKYRKNGIASNLISDISVGSVAIVNNSVIDFYIKNNYKIVEFTKKYSKAYKI